MNKVWEKTLMIRFDAVVLMTRSLFLSYIKPPHMLVKGGRGLGVGVVA